MIKIIIIIPILISSIVAVYPAEIPENSSNTRLDANVVENLDEFFNNNLLEHSLNDEESECQIHSYRFGKRIDGKLKQVVMDRM